MESHIRSIAASASSKLGIMRKALWLFGDPILFSMCFRSCLLPVLEYHSLVWTSVADTHLRLLDHVVSKITGISDGLIERDLGQRHHVPTLPMFTENRGSLYPALKKIAKGLCSYEAELSGCFCSLQVS